MSNAHKIKNWRNANPGRKITGPVLHEILAVDTLIYADLNGANLNGADLYGANLKFATLRSANLQRADLRIANLQHANLQYANLRGANLWEANLRNANLQYARLVDANLQNAMLQHARLLGANLTRADLWDANLFRATGGVAQISSVYPYSATIQPTPRGWYTRVGCWDGPLEDLHKIATSDDDEDWPEARGDEREQRRPLLQALLAVFDTHVANNPDVIDELHERWGNR